MDIKKIDSVTFPVKDYAKSATWYAETLGLAEIWRMEDQKGVGFGVGDNSATLNLSEEPGPSRLIIQVERVEDARKELEAKGVRFEGPTETIPSIGRFAGFRDPDGNRIWLLDYTIEHGQS
ncbi:MAG TPA: VOC family protein [Candidatus Limnocylindria bacterium]|jgi:catechol 2,3-dioxygenase-like lactoylglutathione lyase family enzyme